MSDEQRRAMFARMGSRGAGGSSSSAGERTYDSRVTMHQVDWGSTPADWEAQRDAKATAARARGEQIDAQIQATLKQYGVWGSIPGVGSMGRAGLGAGLNKVTAPAMDMLKRAMNNIGYRAARALSPQMRRLQAKLPELTSAAEKALQDSRYFKELSRRTMDAAKRSEFLRSAMAREASARRLMKEANLIRGSTLPKAARQGLNAAVSWGALAGLGPVFYYARKAVDSVISRIPKPLTAEEMGYVSEEERMSRVLEEYDRERKAYPPP